MISTKRLWKNRDKRGEKRRKKKRGGIGGSKGVEKEREKGKLKREGGMVAHQLGTYFQTIDKWNLRYPIEEFRTFASSD